MRLVCAGTREEEHLVARRKGLEAKRARVRAVGHHPLGGVVFEAHLWQRREKVVAHAQHLLLLLRIVLVYVHHHPQRRLQPMQRQRLIYNRVGSQTKKET